MSTKTVLVPFVFGLAAVATLIGTAALIDFETAPGAAPRPPAVWPQRSKVARTRNRSQIVVIAHPECGCTQATLQELSLLSGANLTVLFFRPNPEAGWTKGRAWDQVALLKGATAQWDDGGDEAKLFGSSTSGTVLLYGPDGELLFHGGITQSRGHAGPSQGLGQLELALRTSTPSSISTPVFGCSLLSGAVRS